MEGSPISSNRWPHIISGMGLLLGLVLIIEHIIVVIGSDPAPEAFYIGSVTSLPVILGLVYGGYWLAASELPSDRYDRVGRWWVIGVIGIVGLIFAINATIRPVTLKMAVGTIRWSAAIGGGIGLLLGVFQARAIQRAIEAERAQLRQHQLQRERDRLDRFASLISHELQSPLDVAHGHLNLLREEQENDRLDTIDSTLDQMSEIIEDTLTLARGLAVGDTEPVEIAECVAMCWDLIESGDAKLRTESTATIEADQKRLQQLFESLFRNALDHGGEAVTIRVGVLEHTDGFYVEDDGPGIPPDERQHVRQIGYQLNRGGSGLGLAIVDQIVSGHEWELTITESADGGARFEITGVTITEQAEHPGEQACPSDVPSGESGGYETG